VTRKLVLLRHGQSQWNLENRFTGWVDVDLSEQGRSEAATAGRLMKEEGLMFDVAHTSVLKRAIHTLQGALADVNRAQQVSGALAAAFERGEPGADLAKVMVASQQSQLAFRATVEVRNRLVQAYQDVMNMPL